MKKKTIAEEKRAVRSYKAKQTHYVKASRRAKKAGGTLTNLLENVVIGYSEGMDVKLIQYKENSGTAMDIFDLKKGQTNPVSH
jgi:hypothetical protein